MTEVELIDSEWYDRARTLRNTFTPAAPVANQDLFAGRVSQILRMMDTIDSPGEHAAIFGERGVGKTSLAKNVEAIASASGFIALRVNCSAGDSSTDIWRKLYAAVDRRHSLDEARSGALRGHDDEVAAVLERLGYAEPSTHDVQVSLELLGDIAQVVVFLDEYDRVGDGEVETNLVDIMKAIADQGINATIVVVGVAADVDALIAEHESIGRGFNEIEMPRMSEDELIDIVKRGLGAAEMSATPEAAAFIARLSTGLPHYTHLMALYAGISATEAETATVDLDTTIRSLSEAVQRAQQHVARLYYDATHSTRANAFREVLLSAALTPTDERGYFAPGDMRDALRMVTGKPWNIPAYSGHLASFADERGPVLERSGQVRRPRYRFVEPLLVPYIAMRAVNDRSLSAEAVGTALAARSR